MKFFSQITREEEQRALDIHKQAIVVDGLACPIRSRGQIDRMLRGGVTAANWTIADADHDLRQLILDIVAWYSLANENNSKVRLVTTSQDIVEAKKHSKLGIVFGLQYPRVIEGNASILEALQKLGVRIFQLSYNERSLLGDGATEKTDSGLSRFGERAIQELNKQRMLIDISHCGRKTGLDAIEFSSQPVVISHSNPKVLRNSPRNKTDEELKAVAEKGGVIGAVTWGPIMWSKERQPPTIEDFLNQIDYMVKLVGVDHVGIGLDINEKTHEGEKAREDWEAYCAKYTEVIPSWFDSRTDETFYPRELASGAQVANITKGLVVRGYSDAEIKQIIGGNFLRVFEKVWR